MPCRLTGIWGFQTLCLGEYLSRRARRCCAQFLDKAVLVCDGVPKEVLSLEARCPGLAARAEPSVVLAGQTVAVQTLDCPSGDGPTEGAEPCQMLCRAGGHYLDWQVGAGWCEVGVMLRPLGRQRWLMCAQSARLSPTRVAVSSGKLRWPEHGMVGWTTRQALCV